MALTTTSKKMRDVLKTANLLGDDCMLNTYEIDYAVCNHMV